MVNRHFKLNWQLKTGNFGALWIFTLDLMAILIPQIHYTTPRRIIANWKTTEIDCKSIDGFRICLHDHKWIRSSMRFLRVSSFYFRYQFYNCTANRWKQKHTLISWLHHWNEPPAKVIFSDNFFVVSRKQNRKLKKKHHNKIDSECKRSGNVSKWIACYSCFTFTTVYGSPNNRMIKF